MSISVSTTSGNTISVSVSGSTAVSFTESTSSVTITSPTTSSVTVTNTGPKGDIGVTGAAGAAGAAGPAYQSYHHNIYDDIGTTKIYLPTSSQSTGEQGTANSVYVPLLAPASGKLLTVVVRVPASYAPSSDATITIGFEKQEIGGAIGSAWTSVETEAVVIAADQDANVVHYTFDSATFSVGEIVGLTIQSDVDPGGSLTWVISSVMEYNWSTQYSGSSAIHT